MQSGFEANLADVTTRVEAAATRSGRDPGDIKIVTVTKTHSANLVRTAIAAGLNIFGENKVQEAETKITELGRDSGEWHLIGHLQSNKARKAVELFDVIESVDSLELAERLERICLEEGRSELPVFAQVDLASEETKSGIEPADLDELAEYLKTCACLRFDGLMVLPPYFEDPEATRPYFKRLRELRDDLLAKGMFGPGQGELSMGMSHDFEVAIEEGATVVRVGTALFGARE